VATRISGHLDAVQHDQTGLLVDPESTEALAEALTTVLADPARRAQLSEGARRHAAALSWDRTATELMRILAAEATSRRRR
jgi:glycosyltransferase involved in cell wall biosynthesis